MGGSGRITWRVGSSCLRVVVGRSDGWAESSDGRGYWNEALATVMAWTMRVLPSPTGRKTIAQRFSAGTSADDEMMSPGGTTEGSGKTGSVAPAGLGRMVVVWVPPSAEALGYCRSSLAGLPEKHPWRASR